ncbi:MAG: cob(I)yrinic acid a,c-diamide adenosyltransferase, partial [Lachnospiraceae bacterium]|nr:cob(I)yrinic acid a,c-diamide adenosyltransferase [Lachnospiraceae bacterium]
MIHLYTGEGKGKTTAAVGLAVRAAGQDIPVLFAQFMKGNDTGELHVLKELQQVRILRSEKNFGFYKQMSEADKQELREI